jgi:hypothetical protein
MQRSTATSTSTPRASATPPEAPLRPAATVMRLARLGSFHPTRLSFVRSLVRRMGRERWSFRQRHHDLDAEGFGRIVYEIETPAGLLTSRLLQRTGPEGAPTGSSPRNGTPPSASAGRIDEAAIELEPGGARQRRLHGADDWC